METKELIENVLKRIDQNIRRSACDNAEYIKGTIAEYELDILNNVGLGYACYLTDEEYEVYEGLTPKNQLKVEKAIKEYIKKYWNLTITEFNKRYFF